MSLLSIFTKAFIKGVGNASGGIIILFTSLQIIKLFKIQKAIESDLKNNIDPELVDMLNYEVQENCLIN